jgi:hypothetical protein
MNISSIAVAIAQAIKASGIIGRDKPNKFMKILECNLIF